MGGQAQRGFLGMPERDSHQGVPARSNPKRPSEIKESIATDDTDVASLILDHSRSIAQSGVERLDSVGSQASTLIGVTGLVSAIVLALLGILTDSIGTLPRWQLTLISVFLAASLILFVLTIIYAINAVRVTSYQVPSPDTPELIAGENATSAKTTVAAELLSVYLANRRTINRKVGSLVLAQSTFMIGILSLLASGALILALIYLS